MHDLSTALYSGSSKGVLDKLEHLLRVYHDNLSNTLRLYDCDPEVLYPFENFKKEWKKYSRYGFMRGVLTWTGKLIIDDNDLEDIDKLLENKASPKKIKIDEEKFNRISQDLVWHMYENDLL